jgi:Mg-chelatase subunit ChlI
MRDTIELAREAGIIDFRDAYSEEHVQAVLQDLKRFEALVRADQDEKYKWDIHSCGPTCKRYACVAMREAVEAEREACAKVCDDLAVDAYNNHDILYEQCADAIRARGKT